MSVFLGWAPDTVQAQAFAGLRDNISSALPADAPRHDWRTPRQWHVTLFYLGERIEMASLPALSDAMQVRAGVPPVDTRFEGAQYWPGARVLVAKLAQTDALMALFRDIAQAATGLGFLADKRKPNPHATLAYLPRGSRPPVLPDASLQATQPLRIDRIQLLRTVPGGYETLAAWPLGTTREPA